MAKKSPKISPGLRELRKIDGMQAKLARHLGISRQAVNDWKVIPIDRLLEIEDFTKIPREKLRPELFEKPKKRG